MKSFACTWETERERESQRKRGRERGHLAVSVWMYSFCVCLYSSVYIFVPLCMYSNVFSICLLCVRPFPCVPYVLRYMLAVNTVWLLLYFVCTLGTEWCCVCRFFTYIPTWRLFGGIEREHPQPTPLGQARDNKRIGQHVRSLLVEIVQWNSK